MCECVFSVAKQQGRNCASREIFLHASSFHSNFNSQRWRFTHVRAKMSPHFLHGRPAFRSSNPQLLDKPVKMASLIPGMRSTALRLSLGPSICRQCLQHQKPAAAARASGIVVQRVGLVVRRQFATTPRWRSATTTTTTTPQTTMPIPQGRSPMAALADKMASTAGGPVGSKTGSTSASSSSFPEKTTSGAVAYWLLGSAASVFGIVVFGGLTRLTESG